MIPYSIQHVSPNHDIRHGNIYTLYDSVEIDRLNETIISYIIEFIDDFCSETTEQYIQITSYKDFCYKFWRKTEFIIKEWYSIFRVYYFKNEWIEWNLEEYQEDIYNAYVKKNRSLIQNNVVINKRYKLWNFNNKV